MVSKYDEARKAIESILGCSIEKLPVREQPLAYADVRDVVRKQIQDGLYLRIAELEARVRELEGPCNYLKARLAIYEDAGRPEFIEQQANVQAQNRRLREVILSAADTLHAEPTHMDDGQAAYNVEMMLRAELVPA